MRYPVLRTLTLTSIIILLTACVPPAQLAAQKKAQEDTNACIQMARDYDLYWKHKKLEKISTDFLKGTGDSKITLYNYHQILNQCENILAKNNAATNQPELASLHDLNSRIENTYLRKEEKLFLDRTGGRTLCPQSTVLDFLGNPTRIPSEQCVYTLSEFSNVLQAMQVTSGGILVKSDLTPGMIFFLYNDNPMEHRLVDGANISDGYFAYMGNYSYNSFIGTRSVYSFRRIENPFQDILFYKGY
jgi:hypothetical protein